MGIVAVVVIVGVWLCTSYLQHLRRVPTAADIAGDVAKWNSALERRWEQKVPLAQELSRSMNKVGLGQYRLYHVLGAVTCCFAAGWGIGYLLFVGPLMATVVAVGGAVVPLAYLAQAVARRDELLFEQMDMICGTLTSLLGSGSRTLDEALKGCLTEQPLPNGKYLLLPHLPPPLGSEMYQIYRDMVQVHMSLPAAALRSRDRINHPWYTQFIEALRLGSISGLPLDSIRAFRDDLDSVR
ncbi:MAG: hypothetical protein ACYDAG_00425, partial [Chloroflexota bacterium]